MKQSLDVLLFKMHIDQLLQLTKYVLQKASIL